MTEEQVSTEVSTDAPTHWPPLAHIWRKTGSQPKKGDVALCGAKLMGLTLPDATKVCRECVELFRAQVPNDAA
jgi:hypothetical protein